MILGTAWNNYTEAYFEKKITEYERFICNKTFTWYNTSELQTAEPLQVDSCCF